MLVNFYSIQAAEESDPNARAYFVWVSEIMLQQVASLAGHSFPVWPKLETDSPCDYASFFLHWNCTDTGLDGDRLLQSMDECR